MKELKVSIVMCTYNGSKYIREQIDSILQQSYPIYEFLIFDDASTDDTLQILHDYSTKHDFIKLHRNQRNIGYAANFRQALTAATGEVICIADQDDIWHQEKIKKLIEHWPESSPLIYCDSIRFSQDIPVDPKPNPLYRRFEGTDPRKIFFFNTVSGHALLLRRQFLSLVFPYPDNIYYDWWMAVVAAYNGGVSYLPETLVFQRIHEKNVTGNTLDHTIKSHRNRYKREVLDHLRQFKLAPNMPGIDKQFISELEEAISQSLHKKFHTPLFLLMIRHGNSLFDHKNKKGKLLRNIKYAFRLTYNYGGE
jgi:glycosyltransferase involved in cell wall biosynthesis